MPLMMDVILVLDQVFSTQVMMELPAILVLELIMNIQITLEMVVTHVPLYSIILIVLVMVVMA